MKRRYLLQSLGSTLGGSIATVWFKPVLAQNESIEPISDPINPTGNPEVEFSKPDLESPDPVPTESPPPPTPTVPVGSLGVRWLYHSCVLFEAEGFKILVNPFRNVGCTEGYPEPAVGADLVLLSSRLFDEGYIPVVLGNPRVLFQPGDYKVEGIRVQGVRMAHDNVTEKGSRFGINIGWRWQQAGIDIVHLGGAAAPITREQSILLSKPDILLVPVGGGPKNYDPANAKAAIEALQPKLVIPTMYRTAAASSDCALVELSNFLSLFPVPSIQFAASPFITFQPDTLPSADAPIILSFGEDASPS